MRVERKAEVYGEGVAEAVGVIQKVALASPTSQWLRYSALITTLFDDAQL